MLEKIEGIVIRTTDYGESHKITAIYSREAGKISAMARGAKKTNSRLAAVSQLFTYGYFLIQTGRGLGTLQQGEIISPLRGLKEDIFKTAYATYIVEMVDRSTQDNEPNPYLFEMLYQSLNYISEDNDPEIITHIFEMKMLQVLGLYPEMRNCTVCGAAEGNFGFSIKENGLICHRCFDKDPHFLPLSQNAIKLLRLFYYFDLGRLGTISVKPETKKELKQAIDMYYDEYSGLYLKSKRFLEQMDSLRDRL
ncbi:DNA repair protein RecO [Siminovitchia acidinfaciens]|uniref:DNA repair protein RecO n=1 Tax=Siminovitchia acidinfaciens TaxID=2321395 RepID=A0A429XYN6_9BACI|nr:DNA repair protein RecO [Siminovitchia acidinfaciens]RST73851.1 DNA repair protein RecO [Siminovitchia acidinfaciens]VEF47763.1 DNA repair protein RecO [Bacillus freudenreichii]